LQFGHFDELRSAEAEKWISCEDLDEEASTRIHAGPFEGYESSYVVRSDGQVVFGSILETNEGIIVQRVFDGQVGYDAKKHIAGEWLVACDKGDLLMPTANRTEEPAD